MKVWVCPNCGGGIKHVTDDIFRCLSCRWSGTNVVEMSPCPKCNDTFMPLQEAHCDMCADSGLVREDR
jgi:hypothetical protein